MAEMSETPAERAAFYMERAKQLSVIGKASSMELERLLKEIFKALSFDATDSKHYMFLAKLFKHALDLGSAIFCYRYALKLENTNFTAKKYLSELLVLHGKELMVTAAYTGCVSKYVAAGAYFEEALEVNREDADIWILKCLCHIHANELGEAYEAINRVIKPNRPASAEAYILRAKILWGRGLVEQGNADIRVAGSLDPDHPEVVNFANRSFVKAEKLYKDCLKAFTAGDMKLALEHVKHALFITSDDVKLHIMLAKIHRQIGDLQSAYTSILKAQSIFEAASKCGELSFHMEIPSDIVRQVNLILNDMSIKYVLEGDYDRGILLLNKIIKTEKSLSRGGLLDVDPKYYLNRGDCYRALHKLSDAIYDYGQALEIAPQDWEIRTRLSLTHYLVATDHFNVSNFVDTERELDKAIGYNPKVSEYYAVRGKARYYNGNFNAAYADFKRTVALDETNEEVRQLLDQFDSEEVAAQSQTSLTPRKKEEVALTLSIENMRPRYSSERQVQHLKVSDSDQIAMMLHPRQARALPNTKMLTTSADISAVIKSRRQVDRPPPRIRNDKAFNRALLAGNELEEKERQLQAAFMQRIDTTKDELWLLIESAKTLAWEQTHPAHAKLDTSSAVKKESKNTKKTHSTAKNVLSVSARGL